MSSRIAKFKTESYELEFLWPIAGEGGNGGADHGPKWNPNTNANPKAPVARPEVAGHGGATARSGRNATAITATVVRQRYEENRASTSTREVPETLLDDPEVGRRPESCQRRWTAAAEVKRGVADSGENGAN